MANKRIGLGILVIVLAFGMMVVGCNNDPSDPGDPGGGDGWLGDTLTITNAQVYSVDFDGTTPKISLFTGTVPDLNYERFYIFPDDDFGYTPLSDLIEGDPSVTLRNGKLNITIGKPKNSSLQNIVSSDFPSGVTVSTPNWKQFYIYNNHFFYNSDDDSVMQGKFDGNTEGSVMYMYVDKIVNITGQYTDRDGSYTFISNYAMNLKAGWNSVIITDTQTGSKTYQSTIKTGTPSADYRWVVNPPSVGGGGGGDVPGDGGGSTGGTFTLTGIPSHYNGKYAFLLIFEYEIIGAQNINMSTETLTLCSISNGSVSIPMWISNDGANSIVQYSGNNTCDIIIALFNDINININDINIEELLGVLELSSVTFKNGNATRSWGQGEFTTGNNDNNIAVTFIDVTANGSSSQTTTEVTLTFSNEITGLSADDITLSGVSGVNKGTVSSSGSSYTLPISGFTAGGSLDIAVAKTGYTISGSPRTVTIYYYSGSSGGKEGTYLDFTYYETDTISITEYNGIASNVTIPTQINGKPVTSIGDWAFYFCTSLTSVTIPDSVTSIRGAAFAGCTNLTSVTFEGTIYSSSFSSAAFFGDLRDKYFASGIGTYTNTNPSNNWPKWKKEGDSEEFLVSLGVLIEYNGPGGIVIIPDNVARIGRGVFSYNSSITSVNLNKVTSIDTLAFYSCTNLTSITIPSSVTRIGDSAFKACTSLTSVTFQGTIMADNLDVPFDGNLRAAYLAFDGGRETYTRERGSNTWKKR